MSARIILTSAFAAIVAACQSFEPVIHDTPSGRPEVTFSTLSVEEARQLIINTNIDEGFILVDSSQNVLEFKKPPERQRVSFYFSEFPRARYPNIRVIYNIFDSPRGARTVASVWIVGSPGTINQYKVGINDQPISIEVQQFLDELAATKVGY